MKALIHMHLIVFLLMVVLPLNVYAGDSLKDRINSEIKKQQESGRADKRENGENEFKKALKEEIKRKEDTVYSKDTLIDTAKTLSLKYLPYLAAALLIMFVLGAARESFRFLIKIASATAFLSLIGYLMIFFVTPIVEKILETVRNIRI